MKTSFTAALKMAVTGPDEGQVMAVAEAWYNTEGPFRESYQMLPQTAMKMGELTWIVQFRVSPDTGYLYSRK